MTVRTRLLCGFGAVVLLLSVPSLFAFSRLTQLRHLAVERRSGQATAVAGLGRIRALSSDVDRLERSFVATADRELGEAAAAVVDSLVMTYDDLAGSAYADQVAVMATDVRSVTVLATEVAEHVAGGRIRDATGALEVLIDALGALEGSTATVARTIDELSRQELVRAQRLSESARIRTLVMLAVALLIGGAVVAVTTDALTNPLLRLRRAMAAVADGSFEAPHSLPYDRGDEIGELARSFRRMTERLEELDRAKAGFLGMASHELKTPLNVIAAYAELIEHDLEDGVSERHREMINAVAEQADVMAKRVSRLMDISRLEAGTYRLAPDTVRVEDLATGVARLFESQCARRDVDFRIECRDDVPTEIVMDVDAIREEVVGNLLANALRFTPDGGWIRLDLEGCEGGLNLVLTDSGPGIPEEHRPYIFDKHYTSDRTRAVGSGLGLAVAKEMVELHGGIISLEEAPPGGGARFRVALPLIPATAELEVPGYMDTATLSGSNASP